MFIEFFLILILIILFYLLIWVRNTLKLLIITISLFLTCSVLLMLKGFTIISCVFILVYAGAILVMICIAFVLSPVIVEKNKNKNQVETVYFEATTELINHIIGGFLVTVFIIIWYSTKNTMAFWDIISDSYINSNLVHRDNVTLSLGQEKISDYEYYFKILNFYNNYNSDYYENLYKNNLYYLFDLYNNTVMVHEEINTAIMKNFINVQNDIFKEQSEDLVELEKKIIEKLELFFGKGWDPFLDFDIEEIPKFKIPKELLYLNGSYEILSEIFKYINYLENKTTEIKSTSDKIFLERAYNELDKILRVFIENQVELEYKTYTLKKMFNLEMFRGIDELKSLQPFDLERCTKYLSPSNLNLKSNQVFYIFKKYKYIIVLVGLYLHFTLLVCLRIFTINQQIYNIKRQDSNDQILKKWKR